MRVWRPIATGRRPPHKFPASTHFASYCTHFALDIAHRSLVPHELMRSKMGTIGSKGAHGIVAARDTGMQLVVDINQQCLFC